MPATASGIAVANLVHASGNIDEAKAEEARQRLIGRVRTPIASGRRCNPRGRIAPKGAALLEKSFHCSRVEAKRFGFEPNVIRNLH